MLVHLRVTPVLILPLPIYGPGQRGIARDVCCLKPQHNDRDQVILAHVRDHFCCPFWELSVLIRGECL